MVMKTRTALCLAIVPLILLTAVSSVGVIIEPGYDISLLHEHSLLMNEAPGSLPTVGEAITALGIINAVQATDMNGIPVLEAEPEMKPCCVPGVNGAIGHTARLLVLLVKGSGKPRFAGLEYYVSGYCTLKDLSEDIASVIVRAESLLDSEVEIQDISDDVLKVLAVAHYDWYSMGNKEVRTVGVSYEGGRDFAIIADPNNLTVRVIWPTVLPEAAYMSSTISSYAEVMYRDPLGLEAVLRSSFNEMAMGRSSDEEVLGQTTEPCDT